jgi:hypothetical protein
MSRSRSGALFRTLLSKANLRITAHPRESRDTPVLVENSATGTGLDFHAACRYSLISPASLARRWIRAVGPGKAMTSGLSSGAGRPMPLP